MVYYLTGSQALIVNEPCQDRERYINQDADHDMIMADIMDKDDDSDVIMPDIMDQDFDHDAIMQDIIAQDGDLDMTTVDSINPLWFISSKGYIKSVKLLLQADAKPDVPIVGMTAFYIPEAYDSRVNILLSFGFYQQLLILSD